MLNLEARATRPQARHTKTAKIYADASPSAQHELTDNADNRRVLRCGCDARNQGWRSAGVELWMGSSTDKQLQRSTTT